MRSKSYVDSNYATNTENRKSVTGMINTVGGTVTNWMSKGQVSVTLSSTEAEYVALATCAQETMFTQSLLDELGLTVRPGIIHEDNTGAMFLVKNRQISARTKHIDVRHHFIRDLWENGDIGVEFVRSENNPADLLTKNLAEKEFDSHAKDVMNGTLACWKEDVRNR